MITNQMIEIGKMYCDNKYIEAVDIDDDECAEMDIEDFMCCVEQRVGEWQEEINWLEHNVPKPPKELMTK